MNAPAGQLGLSPLPQFDGAVYRPGDHGRLSSQYQAIWTLMVDGRWRTLAEVAATVGAGEASVSAQLRHMRKPRFGANAVEKRLREGSSALWEYRLVPTVTGLELVARTAVRL